MVLANSRSYGYLQRALQARPAGLTMRAIALPIGRDKRALRSPYLVMRHRVPASEGQLIQQQLREHPEILGKAAPGDLERRARSRSLLLGMSTLEELGFLPPLTVELDLFDYVPLESPREPPPFKLRARMARGYDADEADGGGLRLAFAAGHPVESRDLLVLAYIWRASPERVAWGVERWPSPERRLRLYRYDSTFEPRTAADVHAELQSLGPASFADHARDLLAR